MVAMVISQNIREMCDKTFLRLCTIKGVTFQVATHHRPIRVTVFRGDQEIARKTSQETSHIPAVKEATRELVPFLERLPSLN